MHIITKFAFIMLFGLIPFGTILIRILFKKTIIWRVALLVFNYSMATGMVAFAVGVIGLKALYWAIPAVTFLLLSSNIMIAEFIQKPLKHLNEKQLELSKGKLNIQIDAKISSRADELGQMARSTEELAKQIRLIIDGINHCSSNIYQLSNHLNNESKKLSDLANSQSGVAEEISSSMEEMATNIENTAENANKTRKMALMGYKQMETSSTAMLETIRLLKEIGVKIKVVSEISSQTNILALNAAVESARAGEHGKGFAVVAAEVRKLAEHSNTTANVISQLSQQSSLLADKSGSELKLVLPEMKETTRMIDEISSATMEQNTGIQQINQALMEFSQTIQKNARSAEDLNERSEMLAHLSDELIGRVAFFKTT